MHASHWRYWNDYHPKFWDWQVNVPLKPSNAQTQRRKAKMMAAVARVRFLNICGENWGYFGFIDCSRAVLIDVVPCGWEVSVVGTLKTPSHTTAQSSIILPNVTRETRRRMHVKLRTLSNRFASTREI